jgi:hypothetical protein
MAGRRQSHIPMFEKKILYRFIDSLSGQPSEPAEE